MAVQKSLEKSLTATGPQLMAIALYHLGGGKRVVDTEDVAMHVHQMAPGRFSWRKYPEQINLELVRVALSDARKPENGSLVAGTGRSGWSLTAQGQSWAKENAKRLASSDQRKTRDERRSGSVDELRWQRERARLITTTAWTQWMRARDRSDIDRGAAKEVFRIDRYSDARTKEIKVNRVREMFEDDHDLADFVEAAAHVVLEEE